MLHEDDLVALGVVSEEFEGVVEQRPLLLVEDLLSCLSLHSHLLLLLLLTLLLLLLLPLPPAHYQRLHRSSIHHVLIDVEVVTAFRSPLLLLLLLGSTQVE